MVKSQVTLDLGHFLLYCHFLSVNLTVDLGVFSVSFALVSLVIFMAFCLLP